MAKTERPTLRQGVALLVQNQKNPAQFLAGLRKGHKEWQFPQGGIDNGETPMQAALRELKEEVGIEPGMVTFLRFLPATTRYELPKDKRKRGFDGQEHTWALFRYSGTGLPDLAQATDKEFSELRWATVAWVRDRTIRFRQGAYEAMDGMLHGSA